MVRYCGLDPLLGRSLLYRSCQAQPSLHYVAKDTLGDVAIARSPYGPVEASGCALTPSDLAW